MDTIMRLRIGDKLRKMKGKEEGVASFRKMRVAYAWRVQKLIGKSEKGFIAGGGFRKKGAQEPYYNDWLYELAEQVIWENS